MAQPEPTPAPAATSTPSASSVPPSVAPATTSGAGSDLNLLREQAEKGEPFAQHHLGVRLWNGTDGCRKDEAEVRAASY